MSFHHCFRLNAFSAHILFCVPWPCLFLACHSVSCGLISIYCRFSGSSSMSLPQWCYWFASFLFAVLLSSVELFFMFLCFTALVLLSLRFTAVIQHLHRALFLVSNAHFYWSVVLSHCFFFPTCLCTYKFSNTHALLSRHRSPGKCDTCLLLYHHFANQCLFSLPHNITSNLPYLLSGLAIFRNV